MSLVISTFQFDDTSDHSDATENDHLRLPSG